MVRSVVDGEVSARDPKLAFPFRPTRRIISEDGRRMPDSVWPEVCERFFLLDIELIAGTAARIIS